MSKFTLFYFSSDLHFIITIISNKKVIITSVYKTETKQKSTDNYPEESENTAKMLLSKTKIGTSKIKILQC